MVTRGCRRSGRTSPPRRDGLARLGVDAERFRVDHGLTGTSRARPGLREALAAGRAGDHLVVTKLDRLARSLPNARDIVEELTGRGVRLQLGGPVHDLTDSVEQLMSAATGLRDTAAVTRRGVVRRG